MSLDLQVLIVAAIDIALLIGLAPLFRAPSRSSSESADQESYSTHR